MPGEAFLLCHVEGQRKRLQFLFYFSAYNRKTKSKKYIHPLDKGKMDSALKNLTGKITFTTTAYDGEGGIDISKNGDRSVIAVVNGQDATVYSKGGVLGINSTNDGGSGMFYNYNATAMDLRGLDTSRMTNMFGMFCYCKKLSSINVSSFDTRFVTNMGDMFYSCSALTTLDLSSFNTSAITDLRTPFSGCENLTICYGRTQADCDKFNSTYKLSNVNFIINPNQ